MSGRRYGTPLASLKDSSPITVVRTLVSLEGAMELSGVLRLVTLNLEKAHVP